MKIIISLITALALFLAFSIWSQTALSSDARKLSAYFEKLEKAVKEDKWNTADRELHQIEKIWGKIKNRWQMLIDHSEVDNIESSLVKVRQMVELREKADCLSETAVLKLLILHIPKKEKLSIVNIF